VTKRRISHVAAAAAVVIVAVAANAADPGGRGGTAPASQLSPRTMPAAPLKGELRLNPGAINPGASRAGLAQTNIDALTQKFNEFSGKAKKYESLAKAVPDISQQCAAKSYSVQDQMAAGCTATDTVAQCTDKLLKHCIQNFSNVTQLPAVGVGGRTLGGGTIGVSTQEFKQSAQGAAADARALSQLLDLYAGQVEQKAKALIP